MAQVLVMCLIEVEDAKVNEDTGVNIQATLESAVQQAMPNLEEHGAVGFTLTFEDMV